jgi:hypothetical protein
MKQKITKEYIIEQIAETIYHTRYQEMEEMGGIKHKLWKSLDHNDIQDEALPEHERDDFRHEAQAAYGVVKIYYKSIARLINEENELIIKDIIE